MVLPPPDIFHSSRVQYYLVVGLLIPAAHRPEPSKKCAPWDDRPCCKGELPQKGLDAELRNKVTLEGGSDQRSELSRFVGWKPGLLGNAVQLYSKKCKTLSGAFYLVWG